MFRCKAAGLSRLRCCLLELLCLVIVLWFAFFWVRKGSSRLRVRQKSSVRQKSNGLYRDVYNISSVLARVLAKPLPEDDEFTYYPSELETEWTSVSRTGVVCATTCKQMKKASRWLDYSMDTFLPDGSRPSRLPTEIESQVLSRFVYKSGKTEMIEPLSGVARHPLAFEGIGCLKYVTKACIEASQNVWNYSNESIYDIRYLVVENLCGRVGPRPRSRFFDLGCTVYSQGGMPKPGSDIYDYSTGGGMWAPSIPLFYNLFRDRCTEFDDIYAWEGFNYNASDWWKPVPVSLRHKVRFYNTNVEELPLPESVAGKRAGDGSFLRMLREVASPSDFVVVKLDIDGGPEMEIAHAIANRPELSALIDVLFFEYHFQEPFLNSFWMDGVVRGSNVDTAMRLMSRLRHLGIRAHFWI